MISLYIVCLWGSLFLSNVPSVHPTAIPTAEPKFPRAETGLETDADKPFTCIKCIRMERDCRGPSVKCPLGTNFCVSQIVQKYDRRFYWSSYFVHKFCGFDVSSCTSQAIINQNDGFITRTSCCDFPDCNLPLVKNGLMCYDCSSHGCKQTIPCPEGTVCMTVLKKVGSTVKVLDKICGKKEQCDQSFSQLVRGKKETNFTTCCDTNYCSPEENIFRNGIMCPFCTKEGSMECTTTDYECMGTANNCFTYTVSGPKKKIIRGCGSKELCGDPRNSFITFEVDGGKTKCTEKAVETSR
ncbi:phospholipase A2 inhibitor subunit gamma B isoform X2 [Xenopus laevis]|uniref:UPAR/Ly6 domain-containing protein n=2 Tax=Xenopus laevis TaxID=8355 RepID=A0A974HCW4_XENLA|nr:phospholipase A2 inhibitor subunit gamma B isoform X2 [Xenopus laevis]OCT73277.1 hypothetical protein XELAEV_18036256mg [Xenopus laevis]